MKDERYVGAHCASARCNTMTRIKICGICRAEDVDAVNIAMPDFVGFVFAPSRRRIDVKTAVMLKERLDGRIEAVGVFVNQEISFISQLHKNGIIDIAQLHGNEDDEYMSELKDSCDCKIIKTHALPPLPSQPLSPTTSPLSPPPPDYLLFDTASEHGGGSGKTFDWDLLKDYSGLPYFLAGGLTALNVGLAIQTLAPYAVDISSGVETDGVKDAVKIIEFVKIVRKNSIQDR